MGLGARAARRDSALLSLWAVRVAHRRGLVLARRSPPRHDQAARASRAADGALAHLADRGREAGTAPCAAAHAGHAAVMETAWRAVPRSRAARRGGDRGRGRAGGAAARVLARGWPDGDDF